MGLMCPPWAAQCFSGTKSLTCPTVAWPGVLGSRQPRAADVLVLPLPWPGEINTTGHGSSELNRVRRATTSQKKDDSGRGGEKIKRDPTSSPAAALPQGACAQSFNVLAFKTQHSSAQVLPYFSCSSLGQPVPPAFPVQWLRSFVFTPAKFSAASLLQVASQVQLSKPHITVTHPSAQQGPRKPEWLKPY